MVAPLQTNFPRPDSPLGDFGFDAFARFVCFADEVDLSDMLVASVVGDDYGVAGCQLASHLLSEQPSGCQN